MGHDGRRPRPEGQRRAPGTHPCGRTPRSETGGALLSLLTTAPSTGWRGPTSTRRACSRRCWTTPPAGSCRVAPTVPSRSPASTSAEPTFSRRRTPPRPGPRVVDAMTFRGRRLGPGRELQRRVHGVTGSVPMAWRVQPRFGYGQDATRLGWRSGIPVATAGSVALAVRTFGAGTPQLEAGAVGGSFATTAGSRTTLALCGAHQEPLVFPTLAELDERLRTRSRAGAPGRPPGPTTGLGGRRFCAARALAAGVRWTSRGRRRHHLAPRAGRRRAQLGLPVLLDP